DSGARWRRDLFVADRRPAGDCWHDDLGQSARSNSASGLRSRDSVNGLCDYERSAEAGIDLAGPKQQSAHECDAGEMNSSGSFRGGAAARQSLVKITMRKSKGVQV